MIEAFVVSLELESQRVPWHIAVVVYVGALELQRDSHVAVDAEICVFVAFVGICPLLIEVHLAAWNCR